LENIEGEAVWKSWLCKDKAQITCLVKKGKEIKKVEVNTSSAVEGNYKLFLDRKTSI